MMAKNDNFVGIEDPTILGRLSRSSDIKVINRFDYFEAINSKNGHKYRVTISGLDIICSCPDAKAHTCKHEIAVARDMNLFNEVT